MIPSPLSRRATRAPRAAVLFTAFALVGVDARRCQGPPPQLSVQAEERAAPCAPIDGEASGRVQADSISGEFALTLVATTGSRAGHSASGRLRLDRYADVGGRAPAAEGQADATVRYPLYGSASVVLDSVGAIAPGDIAVHDPAKPGVLGIEWQTASATAPSTQTMLRLGAEANGGGAERFDGTHMALTVAEAGSSGFSGRWESGGGELRASGDFCAVRVSSRR